MTDRALPPIPPPVRDAFRRALELRDHVQLRAAALRAVAHRWAALTVTPGIEPALA